MKTFKTEIKNVFQQGLKKYGFVKVKGSQPYFVRFVNNEILHVITYREEYVGYGLNKQFVILFGIATVYRKHIAIDETPKYSGEWLNELSIIYDKEDITGLSANEIPFRFEYESLNEESMLNTIKKSFELTERYAVPILDKIITLEDCVGYLYRYKPILMRLYAEKKYIFNGQAGNHNEGLLCVRVFGKERFDEYIKIREVLYERTSKVEYERIQSGKSGFSIEQYEENKIERQKNKQEAIDIFNILVTNIEWKEKIEAELEQRKVSNIALLKQYGIVTIGGNINET